MKTIWIDLDEVLAETIDYCLLYNDYKILWKSVDREKITDYCIYNIDDFNISKEKSIAWFQDPMKNDANMEIRPLSWALEWLEKLKNTGYSLKVVTARIWDIFWEYTQKWLEKYYPNVFDDIIYANHFTSKDKSKSELCKENDIFTMVEDNFDYALDLAQNGIKTYLLEKPWNRHRMDEHKNIIKVKSWQEIRI